jgi:hypothetical protein
VCKQTNAEGWAMYDVQHNAEYIVTAFKHNYALASPPIRLNSERINPDQAMPVIMKRLKGEFRDIDQDLKRQKKQKSPVKRGQREYRVHLLAIAKSSKLDRTYFDKIRNEYPAMQIQKYTDRRYKRYTYGSFAKLSEAQAYMRAFEKLGYGKKDRERCFVAVFVNGKHVENIYAGGGRSVVR